MPPTEHSRLSFVEIAVRFFLPMMVGGAIVYALVHYIGGRDEDDRPPIIVSNGSIEIQEVESGGPSGPTGGKGTLESEAPEDGRNIWQHKHSRDKAKRLHALVEGADAAMTGNCPAVYFAQDITHATIVYSLDSGQRDVIVFKEPGNEPVEISVQQGAGWNQSHGTHTLTLEPETGATLASVTLAWVNGNSTTSMTCQFGQTAAPRIVFLQTTK